jgi:hypothetical protein
VAAPVFANIMEGSLRALGVPPDTALKPVHVDESMIVREGV